MMGSMARSPAGTTHRPGTRARVSARAATSLVVLGLAVTACTGDTSGTPAPSPRQEQVALRVTTADAGARRLTPEERTGLEDAVGQVLSEYVTSGFLGDYPRERFVESFGGFTSGAAALAARDIRVLTASRLADATSVRPRSLDAELSFLVAGSDVVGATAHVDFELEATMPDGDTRDVSLTGRLMLTEQRGRWSVFGFDVAGDDGSPVGEDR